MAAGSFRIPTPPAPVIPSFARGGGGPRLTGLAPGRGSSVEFGTTGLKGIPKIPAMHHPSSAVTKLSAHVSAPSVVGSSITKKEMGLSSSGSNQLATRISASGLGNFMGGSSSGGGMSALEAAQRQWMIDHPGGGSSFVGNIEGGVGQILSGGGNLLSAVGNVLSRPMWALGSAYDQATRHGGFDVGAGLSGAEAGLAGRSREGLGEVFARRGDFGSNGWARAIGSIGTDVIADPLNLLGGVGVDVRLAEDLAKSDFGRQLVSRVLTHSLGEGNMAFKTLGDVVAHSEKAQAGFQALSDTMTPLGKTLGELNREEWAQMAADHSGFLGEHLGEQATTAAGAEAALRGAQTSNELARLMAHQALSLTPHVLRAGLINPLTGRAVRVFGHDLATPMLVKGMRVAPYSPSLLNTAAGLSAVSHVPGAQRLADFIGTHVKAGWQNPLLHVVMKGRTYNAQALQHALLDRASVVAEAARGLSAEEQRRALDVAEQTAGGVHMGATATDRGALNHEAFQQAAEENHALHLSEQQLHFVSAWHDWMNQLIESERAVGLKHQGLEDLAGRVYVPHKMTSNQIPGFIEGASWQRIFAQHARQNPDETLQELARRVKDANGNEFVTDPMDLLRIRTAASARAQSHAALVRTMEASFGQPTHEEDLGAVAAHGAKAEEAQQAVAEHLAAHETTAEEIHHVQTHGGLLPAHEAVIASAQHALGDEARHTVDEVHAAAASKRAEAADLRAVGEEAAATRLPRDAAQAAREAAHPEWYQALREHVQPANAQYRRALSSSELAGQRVTEKAQAVTDLATRHAEEMAGEAESQAVARTHGALVNREARLSKQVDQTERAAQRAGREHAGALQAADEMIQHGHDQVQEALAEAKRGLVGHIEERLNQVPLAERVAGEKVTRVEAAHAMIAELKADEAKWARLYSAAVKSGRADVAAGAKGMLDELKQHEDAILGWAAKGAHGKELPLPARFAEHPTLAMIGKAPQYVSNQERDLLTQLQHDILHSQTVEQLHHVVGGQEALPAGLRDAVEGMHDLHAIDPAEHVNQVASKVNDLAERAAALRQQRGVIRGQVTRSAKANAEHLARAAEADKAAKVRAREMASATRSYQKAITAHEERQARVGVAEAARTAARGRLEGVERPPRAGVHPNYERQAQRLEKQAADLEAKTGQKLHALNQRRGPQIGRMHAKLQRGTQRIIKGYEKRQAEVDRHLEKIDSGELLRRNEVPGHTLYEHDALAGGKGVLLPSKVTEALKQMDEVARDPSELTRMSKWLMAHWKQLVTVGNLPGYRMRNTMSDMWNAYLMGMPLRSMPVYAVRAARLMRAAKAGDRAAVAEVGKMQMAGVTQGLVHSDVRSAVSRFQREAGLARTNVLAKAGQKANDANVYAENLGRITHYLWQMDRLKGTPYAAEEAALRVVSAHFDYADLSGFDTAIKQNLIPFWTWTRKNVPYQIMQGARRPGRMANFFLAAEDMQAAGGHGHEIIPSFFNDSGAIRLPNGMYFLPGIGVMDLARMSSLQGVESMIGPQYQIPAALMTGVNPYTGQKINSDTHPLQPENPFLAALLSRIPGVASGQTRRRVGNQYISSPGVSGFAKYVLSQYPLLNMFQSMNPIQSHERNNYLRALGSVGGLPVYPVDQQLEQQLAQIQGAAAWKKVLQGERDQGLFPEPKQRKTSRNAAILAAAANRAAGSRY